MTATQQKKLRDRGWHDALAGIRIEAFYQIGLKAFGLRRHTESARAQYEIGYRAAKDELRRLDRQEL